MKRILPIIALFMAILTSCGRHNGDTSLYYNSGRTKPIVAVVPVIDSTKLTSTAWNLSEEFTQEIQKSVYNSSKLYLLRQHLSENNAHALNVVDVNKIKTKEMQSLEGAEFVIITELLDQSESAYHTQERQAPMSEVGGLFSIAMRVRILDIRGSEPKIVLQEVIDHDHIIPHFYVGCDYEKMSWGTPAFEQTPMGIAHAKIIRELITHAEGYIGAAKG
jgi:hypothetical protein